MYAYANLKINLNENFESNVSKSNEIRRTISESVVTGHH